MLSERESGHAERGGCGGKTGRKRGLSNSAAGCPPPKRVGRPSLTQLLDFTSLASVDHIATRFQDIASALLNHHHLILRHNGSTTRFRVLELEFYLNIPIVHPDPFCHGHLDQALFAQWFVSFARFICQRDLHSSIRYFHKAPRRTDDANFASPSFHG